MKATLAAAFEPNRAVRARLVRGLKAAGLRVSEATSAEALSKETLVIFGPGVLQASKVAGRVRTQVPSALLLQGAREPRRAPYADGILPLPLSAADLRVRLPELRALRRPSAPPAPAVGDSILEPNTGFYRFSHFKDFLLVEVKRARRYGLNVGLAVMAFDPLPASVEGPLAEQLFGGLALAIRRSLRDTDFPVHYSAGRVLVLMPHTALDGAVTVSRRICARVGRSSLAYENQALRPTLSVGVAAAPTPGQEMSFSELFKAAQRSLEEAQAAGGNRVRFFDAGFAAGSAADAEAAEPDPSLPVKRRSRGG